ncbi:uncharacterized protein LOC104891398 [Beta vulgaris subsp. vulgaris]|uniref:uncharacterized protein LOC104891398 n=1 Tax=Beta vulgaris subsp. vulgaris TaxID=3555 RepID=UPI00203687A3|nr:uncharacterized protein LOC104891398 [Beta vulgaris subsp. vulgaris]
MEACFLGSNIFTKTTELIPLTKSKLFTAPKKTSLLQSYKHGSSSSITCCQLGSSSSKDEDINPTLSGDWRSFRAKLVAAEKISSPGEPLTSSASTNIDPPKLTIDDKWAHTIPQPEKGCLLIATEKLDGVHIFERTVILILATGPIGPTGLILNRPSLMSIKETKSTVLDPSGTFLDQPLYFGGPLEEGLFLVNGPKEGDDDVGKSGVFDEVMKGMYYGTKESVGCVAEMVKRNMIGLDNIRFFDGYCGWEREQLQEEIRAGYWTVAACSQSVIELENVNSGGMWEDILGLMGQKKVW